MITTAMRKESFNWLQPAVATTPVNFLSVTPKP
jgi:hypothetical protein